MTRGQSCRGGGLRQARHALCAALLCGAALGPAPALAQSTDTATTNAGGQVVVVTPLSLVKVRDMDFARIGPRPTAGTVVLNPATEACAPTGGLVTSGQCSPAEFVGMGARRMMVRFQVTPTINLTGPGQAMVLDTMVVDTSPDLTFVGGNGNGLGAGNRRYRIESNSGIFAIQVGGTLRVNANQAPGRYTGTLTVTVQYN